MVSPGRLPWPIVQDAFLAALAIQVVLAVFGHLVGFIGRHFGVASIVASAFLGFIFGAWANPTPALSAAAGGAVVAGGSALVGAIIALLLRDGKAGSLLWIVLIAVLAGAIAAAIGSVVGRSVFGS